MITKWMLLLLASAALAQDTQLTGAGAWEHGDCHSFEFRDDSLAYMGNGHMIDLVNTASGLVLERFRTPEEVGALRYEDGLLLSWGHDSLRFWDATLPGTLDWLASWEDPTSTSAHTAQEGRLFCMSREDSLYVLDIADPALPVPFWRGELQEGSYWIDLEDSLLSVQRTDAALDLIDLSDPFNPAFQSTITGLHEYLPQPARRGQYLLALMDSLRLYSLADPASPLPLSALPLPDSLAIDGLDMGGGKAACTDFDGFLVFDLSNPLDPQLSHFQEVYAGFELPRLRADRLVVAGRNKCRMLDLDSAGLPLDERLVYTGSSAPQGLHTVGSHALLGLNIAGMVTVDLNAPGGPQEVGDRGSWPVVRALDGQGNWLAIASDGDGLQILDASDPLNLQTVWTAPSSPFDDFRVDNGLLFGWNTDSLFVLDPSPPNSPVLRDALPHSGYYISDIALGDGVLIASYVFDDEVEFFDISDPEAVTSLGPWTPAGLDGPRGGDIDGGHGVLASYDSLLLFSLASGQPELRSALPAEEFVFLEAVWDGERLFAASSAGLHVYAVPRLTTPIELAFFPTPEGLRQLHVEEDRVLALGTTGLFSWSRADTDLDLRITPVLDGADTIELSWNLQSFAAGYAVYSRLPYTGPWVEVAQVTQDRWTEAPFGPTPTLREYRVLPLGELD